MSAPSPARRAFLRGAPAGRGAGIRIGEACLAARGVVCQSCRDACGEAAVAFSWGRGGVPRPLVDAGRCTGCGDCVPACPAGAIALRGAAA